MSPKAIPSRIMCPTIKGLGDSRQRHHGRIGRPNCPLAAATDRTGLGGAHVAGFAMCASGGVVAARHTSPKARRRRRRRRQRLSERSRGIAARFPARQSHWPDARETGMACLAAPRRDIADPHAIRQAPSNAAPLPPYQLKASLRVLVLSRSRRVRSRCCPS